MLVAGSINANALEDSDEITVGTPTLDTISTVYCVEGSEFSICEIDILGKRACYIERIVAMINVDCELFDYTKATISEIHEKEALEASGLFKVR